MRWMGLLSASSGYHIRCLLVVELSSHKDVALFMFPEEGICFATDRCVYVDQFPGLLFMSMIVDKIDWLYLGI